MNHLSNIVIIIIIIYREGEIHISPNTEDWFLNQWSTGNKVTNRMFFSQSIKWEFQRTSQSNKSLTDFGGLIQMRPLYSLISAVELGVQTCWKHCWELSLGEMTLSYTVKEDFLMNSGNKSKG